MVCISLGLLTNGMLVNANSIEPLAATIEVPSRCSSSGKCDMITIPANSAIECEYEATINGYTYYCYHLENGDVYGYHDTIEDAQGACHFCN